MIMLQNYYPYYQIPTSFFKEITQKDIPGQIEQKFTKILKMIKGESVISVEFLRYLKPSSSVVSKLYGLPKVLDKEEYVRLILHMNNSSYNATAK